MYIPSWQEVATTLLPVCYGIILIMISYRYLPIFPKERELNAAVAATPVIDQQPEQANA
jgi:molybdopterin-containing oxidoreductase family membrane subunit